MMLSFEECKKIALEFVSNLNMEQKTFWSRLEQLKNYTEVSLTDWNDQSANCYVFSYQSLEYLESRDFKDMLAGNGPIIIDRRDGTCLSTGTAHPFEYYIENYEERGDPFKEKSSTVKLVSWNNGFETISAIKVLKSHSDLDLKTAKEIVEDCLAGNSPLIKANDVDSAGKIVSELEKYHFSAKQI